jgi:transcriptional regulator with PAS, ATPase and Fis domain
MIEKRDFSSASTEIVLLQSLLPSDEQILKSELLLLEAKCLYFTGKYASALDLVGKALELSRPTAEHALYAEQKLLLGRILNLLGRTTEAVEELTESYAFFRREDQTSMSLDALVTLGLVHQARGDLSRSRAVFEEVREKSLRHELGLDFLLATLNLCRVCLLLGELPYTLRLLDECEPHAENESHILRVTNLRGMGAVLALESQLAGVALEKGLASYRRMNSERDVAICLEYLGLNEFFAGNYAKAKEYYQQILAMPEPTASAVAQTLRMLTDVYIAEGNWKKAKETAVKAGQAITNINERIELAALWRAQAQIAERDRDHDVARDLFQKSIDLLQQCGARYELALTHFAAGQSTVHSLATRSEHLEKAKTLFMDMDVPKRITQAEDAIARLSLSKSQCKSVRSTKSSIEIPDIITQDPEMVRILADAVKFAATDMTILITGETGTGKDLLAKYIHFNSKRAAGPFCNENMSRFPRELIDSELFGYEKGSHSRADRNRAGVIELADGGTFCLNEIVELPLDMQARLLQVIEEGTMRRVGGGVPRPVDVRFIAMTNGDLEERVEVRLFRQDLFYRLQDFHLHLPPLRERLEDLPLLVQHFLRQLDFADYDLKQSMLIVEQCGFATYDWPGNVRELKGVLKKAVTLTPSRLLAELVGRLTVRMGQLALINSDEAVRARLVKVLEQNGGNKSATARQLRIPLTTLWNQLKRYGIS